MVLSGRSQGERGPAMVRAPLETGTPQRGAAAWGKMAERHLLGKPHSVAATAPRAPPPPVVPARPTVLLNIAQSLPQALSPHPIPLPGFLRHPLSTLLPADPTPRAAGAHCGLRGGAGLGERQGPGRPADRPRLEPLQQYPPGAGGRAAARRGCGGDAGPAYADLFSVASRWS